ncbi:MAG TPA: hypothetical protein VEF91_08165 [Verrucomicrobiae bacterium]|nr:hypothetical protein [Verrucomicrobiae bacterium]
MSLASLASKLKGFNRVELAALAFYALSGIILLVFLPLTGFPPQLALLGILSLITDYSIFTKRGWAPWLLFILFAGASTFSIYTLAFAGFSNALLGISLTVYVVLTWIFAAYILLTKR